MKSRPGSITLKQLKAFSEVIERRSLTMAARTLNLSVPAVHAQLRGLTAAADAELLARDEDGGWSPTAEGAAMLEAAKAIQASVDGCMRRVRALRDGSAGTVSLGVVSTAKYFAPYLVAQLLRTMPDVEILLRVGNRQETIAALAEGQFDLCIMGRPPRLPAVNAETIGPHPHVIIAAPDHPLATAEAIEPERLLQETFLLRETGSGTRILMTRYLDQIGSGAPYRAIEMGTNETIKQAVMAGLGIAFISQHTVSDELSQGRVVALGIEGLPIVRQWFLIHLAGKPLLPAARSVFSAIREMHGSFLPRSRPAFRWIGVARDASR